MTPACVWTTACLPLSHLKFVFLPVGVPRGWWSQWSWENSPVLCGFKPWLRIDKHRNGKSQVGLESAHFSLLDHSKFLFLSLISITHDLHKWQMLIRTWLRPWWQMYLVQVVPLLEYYLLWKKMNLLAEVVGNLPSFCDQRIYSEGKNFACRV